MCMEDWCVETGHEFCSLHEGGENVLKYLKRGWNRKDGSGNKNLKNGRGGGGQVRLRGGCLKKKSGGWNPLRNYVISFKHLITTPAIRIDIQQMPL